MPHVAGERKPRWTACRSATTRCSRTATPRGWSAEAARSTGSASPASTRRRCSAGSWTRRAGISRSGPQASSRSAAATWSRRWCLRPRSPLARGTAVLTDALATGRDERGHHLGADSPGTLLRSLACTQGEIEAELSYAPRPEYGLVHPILFPVPGGLIARGGASRLLLSTSVGFAVEHASATARVRLTAGQTAVFALGVGHMAGPPLDSMDRRRDHQPAGRHRGGLAFLVSDSRELRRAVARAGAPFRAGAAGA